MAMRHDLSGDLSRTEILLGLQPRLLHVQFPPGMCSYVEVAGVTENLFSSEAPNNRWCSSIITFLSLDILLK